MVDLDLLYMVDISPPMISEPSACRFTSIMVLRRNLSQHAEFNQDIVATGSKAELVARLEDILTTRKADMLVIELIAGKLGCIEEDD